MVQIMVVAVMVGIVMGGLPCAYSEISDVNTSKQTTLSGDLLNDPLAQEILQKIAESKRKIEKLEQQNYDTLKAQKFLEERRAVALERLNQALVLWEEKWYEFSPKVAYQKFIDKMPSKVQDTYAKQFEFTESKHNAGIYAKEKVLAEGSTAKQGVDEFRKAAKSTLTELAKYNEKIQPDYNKTFEKKLADRIAYWNDMINNREDSLKKENDTIEKEYSIQLLQIEQKERDDVRQTVKLYKDKIIDHNELSEKLEKIREDYEPLKEEISDQKRKNLSEIETKYDDWMPNVIAKLTSSRHPMDSEIEIVQDNDTREYHATTITGPSINEPVITGLVTSPDEIHLFWRAPLSMDKKSISGYKIEVKQDDQPFNVVVENTNNTYTSFIHTDLANGEFYTYRVYAITEGSTSDPSNEIGASTAVLSLQAHEAFEDILAMKN